MKIEGSVNYPYQISGKKFERKDCFTKNFNVQQGSLQSLKAQNQGNYFFSLLDTLCYPCIALFNYLKSLFCCCAKNKTSKKPEKNKPIFSDKKPESKNIYQNKFKNSGFNKKTPQTSHPGQETLFDKIRKSNSKLENKPTISTTTSSEYLGKEPQKYEIKQETKQSEQLIMTTQNPLVFIEYQITQLLNFKAMYERIFYFLSTAQIKILDIFVLLSNDFKILENTFPQGYSQVSYEYCEKNKIRAPLALTSAICNGFLSFDKAWDKNSDKVRLLKTVYVDMHFRAEGSAIQALSYAMVIGNFDQFKCNLDLLLKTLQTEEPAKIYHFNTPDRDQQLSELKNKVQKFLDDPKKLQIFKQAHAALVQKIHAKAQYFHSKS